ncbi:MAG: hypothetical protein KDJ52_28920 [Anaerolineae bacterium]|nr:hypothetical protein [Anaerolineae bacterium]
MDYQPAQQKINYKQRVAHQPGLSFAANNIYSLAAFEEPGFFVGAISAQIDLPIFNENRIRDMIVER